MKLKREQLGIAGLKDKEGITKQRISISKKKSKNLLRKTDFFYIFKRKNKNLKKLTARMEAGLLLGKNKGNHV